MGSQLPFRYRAVRTIMLAVLTGSAVGATAATAAVTISSKTTRNMACSGGVCTPTAKNAVLNVTDLANMLAISDIRVAPGAGAKDIVLSAPLSWVSARNLTLDAYQSITFEKPVVVAGPGGLTIVTDDGGTGGEFSFAEKGRVGFWDLDSGLIINGKAYKLVDNIHQLAKQITKRPSGYYALAKSYNLAHAGTFGVSPIVTPFAGIFEGLGNQFSNLTIENNHTDSDFGLFRTIGAGSVVRDISVVNAHIHSAYSIERAGALVGESDSGAIIGSHASVDIDMDASADAVGGLVGANEAGIISESSTSGQLSGTRESALGGLAGRSDGASAIRRSSSSTVIEATFCIGGGLVGWNGSFAENDNPQIIDSFASGNVTCSDAGGLVGLNSHATVGYSHASGTITTGDGGDAGGLVGFNNGGSVSNSFASGGATTGDGSSSAADAGGLVGANETDGVYVASITQSYATGNVKGGPASWIGGLLGTNQANAVVSNTYATGSVTGDIDAYVGGTVGYYISGSISNSYSTGQVTAGQYVGGAIGRDHAGPGGLSDLYWDTQTSGTTLGIGHSDSGSNAGVNGLTTAQFESGLPTGFDSSIWAESGDINGGFPYLLTLPPS